MASKDKLFALQAYVIATSIISVLLLIGVFLLWRSHSDLLTRHAEQTNQLNTAKKDLDKAGMKIDRFKSMLGYGTATAETIQFAKDSLKDDADMPEIEKNFDTDMAVFGPAAAKPNYREFPRFLIDTILTRNKSLRELSAEVEKQTAEKKSVVDRETAARQAAVAEKEKAEADLAAARTQHAADVARLNAEKDTIQKMVNQYKKELEDKNRQIAGQRDNLQKENQRQTDLITAQSETIKSLKKEDFDEPAGVVTQVAQGGRVVWVNIGKEDGLREGVSFVILDESTLNVAEPKIKAEMVVESVDPHMARARVISPISRKVTIPGDKVYSPAWRKGRSTSFALVGLMDINGDGIDDRDLLKSIIANAGGKVVEEILPNGTRQKVDGDGMDHNTTYLVIGTDYKTGENANKDQLDKSARYNSFVGDAKALSITQINIDKLLGYLKSSNDTRTVPLGSQIQGTDFAPRSGNGTIPTSRGEVSELFRKRTPAAASAVGSDASK